MILPFLATVFLCAAVISGRVYCLPAAAFVASFIVQTQIGLYAGAGRGDAPLAAGAGAKSSILAGTRASAVRQPSESDGDHRGHSGHCLDAAGNQADHGDAGQGLGNHPLFRRARRRPLLAGGGKDARLHDGGVSRLACWGRSEAGRKSSSLSTVRPRTSDRPAAGDSATAPPAACLSACSAAPPRFRLGPVSAGRRPDSLVPVLYTTTCRRRRVSPRLLDDGPGLAEHLRHRRNAACSPRPMAATRPQTPGPMGRPRGDCRHRTRSAFAIWATP